MFEVVTPVEDPAILSTDELRLAAGLLPTDTSKDGVLTELGLQASDAIALLCKLANDGVNAPTLLSETCRDTFRLEHPRVALVLSRRFVTALASVVEDGVTLAATDYELDRASGILKRISGEAYVNWSTSKIIVNYTAGFSSPTSNLKRAANLLVKQMVSEDGRDLMVRRERTDGVGETEYFATVDGKESPLASAVKSLLRPYTNWLI